MNVMVSLNGGSSFYATVFTTNYTVNITLETPYYTAGNSYNATLWVLNTWNAYTLANA